MKINFASDPDLISSRCAVTFPEPEIIGFTGCEGYGDTALFGNQMASVVRLDDGSYRVYLTRRLWFADRTTRMAAGYIDTPSLSVWPEIGDSFKPLRLEGIPEGVSTAQPYVLRRDGRFELFFWIHGAGLIRYVKAVGSDGIGFRVVNLADPCLYHPADQAVRTDGSADGFLTVKENLQQAGTVDVALTRKISNDATTLHFDPLTGAYVMYSVLLLNSANAPERRVDFDNAPGWLRVIHRRTSTDGVAWSDAEIVLLPEAHERPDLQFYALQSLRQSDRVCGVAGYYPVRDQVMELEPMVSADGRHWKRGYQPWSIRERIPGCDWPVMMLFPGGMIEADGWIWLNATAFIIRHNQSGKLAPHEYRQESLILRQRSDRWAGLVNRDGIGEIITAPLRYEPCVICADDPAEVKVELLSPYGNELAGNGGVAPDGAVVFADGADVRYRGDWVRFRLRFGTTVYNLQNRE